jgi:hypothetical protein
MARDDSEVEAETCFGTVSRDPHLVMQQAIKNSELNGQRMSQGNGSCGVSGSIQRNGQYSGDSGREQSETEDRRRRRLALISQNDGPALRAIRNDLDVCFTRGPGGKQMQAKSDPETKTRVCGKSRKVTDALSSLSSYLAR